MPTKPHDFLPDPPRGIYRFIEKMRSAALAAHEKRQRPRHSIMAVVVAQPVNAAGEKAGEPFKAVTRDLSTAGLSLLHTRMVNAKFLAIEILNNHGDPIRAHLQVIRCHSVGPFYSIAGSFIERPATRRGIPDTDSYVSGPSEASEPPPASESASFDQNPSVQVGDSTEASQPTEVAPINANEELAAVAAE